MPINLDSIEEIKRLDAENMSGSIEKLASQVLQVKDEVKKVKIPATYKKVKNIVYVGMGGSALGAHCIRSVFAKDLKIPMEIVNDYDLPGTVNKDTLVFISSYSGKTEETVSGLEKARAKNAKIIIITSGGDLAELSKKYKLPALVFGTQNNPCGSPRMGLGYTLFSPLFILARLGYISTKPQLFDAAVKVINKFEANFGLANPTNDNLAKQIAGELLVGPVWYVASGHLSGNSHVAANQMNENAKRFGGYFLIPELNHHLLEGLVFPKTDPGTFLFIFSELYSDRVKKRYDVTREILTKQGKRFVTYECVEKEPFLQSVEVLALGSYLSFYTAMLEGIDPTAIPTVDFLKAALKKN